MITTGGGQPKPEQNSAYRLLRRGPLCVVLARTNRPDLADFGHFEVETLLGKPLSGWYRAREMAPEKKSDASAAWADVMRVSQEVEAQEAKLQAQHSASSEAAETPASELVPGDQIEHPKHGACTVHRVVRGVDELATVKIFMAPVNGKVLCLQSDRLRFHFVGVQERRRVFRYTPKQAS